MDGRPYSVLRRLKQTGKNVAYWRKSSSIPQSPPMDRTSVATREGSCILRTTQRSPTRALSQLTRSGGCSTCLLFE